MVNCKYMVRSVREELWVSQWFVFHAKDIISEVYDGCGNFSSYEIDVTFVDT